MSSDAPSAILFDDSSLPPDIRDREFIRRLDLTTATASGVDDSAGEPPCWAWYPWRDTLAHIPGPNAFRRIRLDRNRNKLTLEEQRRAGELTIGVVGLSVGHTIAHTLALEGLAGKLRLADFDELELTNLNRVPATIFDIGLNKAVVAARRISEIDPYLPIDVFTDGLTIENLDRFIDGVDIMIEECDNFGIKVLVRDRCRERGIPVLMETSDRGTVDIERFDLEPDRPLFHGIVGDLRAEDLADLDRQELTAYAAAILQPEEVSARMAASALEVGRTFQAWPQLGGDVALGGASIAAAVRRLVRGDGLPSGRVRIDLDDALATIDDPVRDQDSTLHTASTEPDATPNATGDPSSLDPSSLDTLDLIAYAGTRAPSAGNQQPWHLTRSSDEVVARIDPSRSSTLDIDHRASAVALGAVAFNMATAAAERGVPATLNITGDGADVAATLTIGPTGTADSAHPDTDGKAHIDARPVTLAAVLARSTRRPVGDRSPLTAAEADDLTQAASTDRTRLVVTDDRGDIERYGAIAAQADRIRFLTPTLHTEMFEELAPSSSAEPLGIDIASLQLPAAMTALFGVLRRADVMALLTEWDLGGELGADAARRVASSSAVIGLIQHGRSPADYVRGGIVAQRVWLAAEALGFAVHPVTPLFLYAHDADTIRGLSPRYGDQLIALRDELADLWPHADDEAITIALRLSRSAAGTDPVSRRLPVADVLGRRPVPST